MLSFPIREGRLTVSFKSIEPFPRILKYKEVRCLVWFTHREVSAPDSHPKPRHSQAHEEFEQFHPYVWRPWKVEQTENSMAKGSLPGLPWGWRKLLLALQSLNQSYEKSNNKNQIKDLDHWCTTVNKRVFFWLPLMSFPPLHRANQTKRLSVLWSNRSEVFDSVRVLAHFNRTRNNIWLELLDSSLFLQERYLLW